MGAYSGPEISNEGLVFHFDMNNTDKSWKGAPTTNYYRYSYPNYVNWNSQDIVVERPTSSITKLYSTSGVAFTAISSGGGYYTTNADTFSKLSYTVKARGIGIARLQVHQANVNPNSGHSGINGPTLALTDQWQTLELKDFYHASNVTSQNILVVLDAGANNYIEVKEPQIEFSDFPTAYVDGTRSSTQAIIDITQQNTITISNLSYNSDNTFEFDGTDDYITLSSSIDCYNKSFTIEAWIKRNVTGVNHGIIGDLQYNWFMFYVTSGNVLTNRYGYYNEVPQETKTQVYGSTTIGTDWTHVAVTFENGIGQKLYVNGELDGSSTNPNAFELTGGSRGPRYIGRADNSAFGSQPNFFNGSILELKGYSDKALTAKEVKNNYLATKSRYGL